MTTNYLMIGNRRDKIQYTCVKCNREGWTLRQNYAGEGKQICPFCKRKEGKETRFCSKCGKEYLIATTYQKPFCPFCMGKETLFQRIGKYGSGRKTKLSEETKKRISETLKNRSEQEKVESYRRKTETQRARYNGQYFSNEAKKNLGSKSSTEETKKKISAKSKLKSFIHRNSAEHIEYEKTIIKKRGYEILSIEKDENQETFFKLKCRACGETFEWHMIGDVYRPYCSSCWKAPYSKLEKELVDYLKSILPSNERIIENDRKILNGRELDIVIPKYHLAIEFDGVYWHNNKDNSEKFEIARQNGIRLIRITEPEWKSHNSLVKNFLKSSFSLFERKVGARECEVKEISTAEYKKFTEENHLQGYLSAPVKLGLFDKNKELLQIMSFSKPRFSKKYDYEMIRECSLSTVNVIGGKSKLLAYFEKKYHPKSLVSYCEKDKFSGKSYEICGFNLDHESKANYTYFHPWTLEPYSRQQFQKRKLPKLLEKFDESLTEWENMEMNGYLRLFDYGQKVYVKNY